MKVAEKNSQSGRWGYEAKHKCCNKYMRKVSVRVPLLDHQNKPVGWVCMICGAIKLDNAKFDEIKDLFD